MATGEPAGAAAGSGGTVQRSGGGGLLAQARVNQDAVRRTKAIENLCVCIVDPFGAIGERRF
jgi:hypothetical protein